MPGNSTSLYSSTGSTAQVSGTNTSGLYGSTGTVTVGTSGYGNANVAAFLAQYTGNLQAGNAEILDNLVVGGTITGTFAGNVTGNVVAPGLNTQVVFNNTGVLAANSGLTFTPGTQTLAVGGPVSAVGNVTGLYILGNGSQLTGLPEQYGNGNVAAFLANFGSNTISTSGNITTGNLLTPGLVSATGNVTGNYILGNGSQLSGIVLDISGNLDGNILGNGFGISNVAFLTSTGNLGGANLVLTGNIYYGNSPEPVGLGQVIAATGSVANSAGEQLTFSIPGTGRWLIDFTTNSTINKNTASTDFLSMGLFWANGVQIGNTVSIIDTDTGFSIGQFTNSGSGQYIITTTGPATVFANAVASNGVISSTSFGTFTQLDPIVAFQSISYTGNLNFAGNITANAGNVTASDALVGNSAVVAGNVTAGNILTLGQVSAAGNVTGAYLLGNGAFITGLPAGYSNANATSLLANFGSNTISTSGNITSGNIIADGQFLTNLPGANVTGTVANATYALSANNATFAGTVTTNAQPNITSVGNLTSLTVAGDSLMMGNLQVNGNVTYINSNVVTINDKFINLANNAANASQANGGGIGIGPIGSEYATWTFSDSASAWQSNLQIQAPSASVTGNVTANTALKTDKWTIVGNRIISPVGGSWESDEVNLDEILQSRNDGYIDVTARYANGERGSEIHLEHGLMHLSTNPVVDPKYWYFYGNGLMTAAGDITTTGNITANYFIGDGSLLTNITAGNIVGAYGNSNVATFLANFGSNIVATTGNITSGNIIANGQFLTNLPGANVTGTVANATYALNANSATFAGTVTTNAQPNITSVGTLSSLTSTGNVTGGNLLTGGLISATGNITANYYFGDGSQLTGMYGNANVANYLPTFTGNVGAGNLVMTSTSGVAYVNTITGLAGQPVTITADGTEDIHLDADSIRVGDNNADATIVTHGTGDLILRTNEGSATEGNIILRDGASGNIDIQTNGSGVVNITGTAGLRVADGISAVGNITANYFLGNGSQLTGITTAAGGSNTQIQFNDGGAFAGNNNVTFNKATGNLAMGNIVMQTATSGTLGVYQNWFQNPNPYGNASATIAQQQQARYLFGAGLGPNANSLGDFSSTYDPVGGMAGARIVLADRIPRANASASTRGLQMQHILDIDSPGNTITNMRFLQTAGVITLVNGNVNVGVTSNLINQIQTIQVGNSGAVVGAGPANISLATNFGAFGNAQDASSTLRTLIGYISLYSNGTGNANVIGNVIGLTGGQLGGNTGVNNYSLVYLQPQGNPISGFGVNQLPTTYRFLNNNDWRSSSILGPIESSLGRQFTVANTTGAVTLNWLNGTTQWLQPTGNVTLSFTGANVSSNGNLTHTVDLTIQQGATGYDVTLPAGTVYTNQTQQIPNAANSISRVVLTARNNAGSTQYLADITSNALITLTAVSATGNITGNYFLGNGSQLTGIVTGLSGNLTGNVFANGFQITSLANGNVTITANGTGFVNTSRQKMLTFAETVYAMGNQTGNLAANIDINNGSIQTMTLTGNITANSIQNMAAGQSATLIITQDGTGNRILSSTMKFAGGFKTLSTAASSTDIITVTYDGTNYWASLNRGFA